MNRETAISLIRQGIAASENNLLEQAEELLSGAVNCDPEYPPGYYNLGVVFLKVKKPEKAAAAFEKYFSLSPDSSNNNDLTKEKGYVYNDIGALFFSAGNFKQAREYFKKALSADRNLEDARFNLLLVNTYLETIL